MKFNDNVLRDMPDIANDGQPDVAGHLEWVGMNEIEVPVRIEDGRGDLIQSTAIVTAYVNLVDPDVRGGKSDRPAFPGPPFDYSGDRVRMTEQFVGFFQIAAEQRLANIGTGRDLSLHLQRRHHAHFESMPAAFGLHALGASLSVSSEVTIVPDYQRAHIQAVDQVVLDKVPVVGVLNFFVEVHHVNTIERILRQQVDTFLDGRQDRRRLP